jgi:WD40 repeat protein
MYGLASLVQSQLWRSELGRLQPAFSPDGRTLAAGDDRRQRPCLPVERSDPWAGRQSPGTHGQQVNGVAFRAGGIALACATTNAAHATSIICVWEVASRELIGTRNDPHGEGGFRIKFSLYGGELTVGHDNANTYLWDMNWLCLSGGKHSAPRDGLDRFSVTWRDEPDAW